VPPLDSRRHILALILGDASLVVAVAVVLKVTSMSLDALPLSLEDAQALEVLRLVQLFTLVLLTVTLTVKDAWAVILAVRNREDGEKWQQRIPKRPRS